MQKTPNLVQAWSTAARLRTLPIPTIQVLTGTCLAYSQLGHIDWAICFYTWLVAIFITIGTNLINDVIDFEKGADQPSRVGFIKVISAGIIPKGQIKCVGLVCFALAIVSGLCLAFHVGSGIFGLVLLSVICGYCYTGGPYPISYLGLSELFILVFYGGVCVGAAYYVQTKHLSTEALLCALQMGLLAILPNALNNLRDIFEDAKDGKLTLAVRFGRVFAHWEIAVITFLPFILGLGWLKGEYHEAAFIPFLLIPIAFLFVQNVWKTTSGSLFNKLFGLSVMVHFSFGLLLVIGFFLK
jgi:1,4-dihydroxy-2-naphthoate polyprenyltransferase